jgi:serine/threonine-protein kinase
MRQSRAVSFLPSRASGLALAIALAASAPAVAHADPSAQDRASAQALFDDARRLMAEKKYAEACPKLEESQRIDPGLGTLLNLAECQALIGKTASAWANFLEAAYQAKNSGQTKRENTARDRAAKLESKLSKLTILAVPTGGVQLEIKRDGIVVSPSLVGTSVPVDPGDHIVSVTAPGKKPWQTQVTIKPDGHLATVSVPQLEDEVSVKPTPAPLPPPPEVKPSSPPPEVKPTTSPSEVKPAPPPPEAPLPDNPRGTASLQVAGSVVGVLGLAGLGTGGAFAYLAHQKYHEADKQCPANSCTTRSAYDAREEAIRDANIATGAIVGGAVLAAGGLALLIVAGRRSSPPPVTALVSIDPGRGAAFGLKGSF